jgi:hypothetical protein
MNVSYSAIASTIAAVLAGAALAAALTNTGPTGPRGLTGSQGQAGKNISQTAQSARLGVCWDATYGNTSDGISYVETVTVAPPVISGGVYQCGQGLAFVTVVPQASTTQANG